MLKKKYRLSVQTVFQKKAQIIRTPYFLIKYFSGEYPYCRFGVIVSKKIANKAVKRNKLRRTIFSACEPYIKKWAGRDFLIIASPKIMKLKKDEIMIELKEALSKLK
jgi:ribonuclease P protein component